MSEEVSSRDLDSRPAEAGRDVARRLVVRLAFVSLGLLVCSLRSLHAYFTGSGGGRRRLRLAVALAGLTVLSMPFGCGAKHAPSTAAHLASMEAGSKLESGVASWYGHPFHGRRTANGEVYDMHKLTAAHRTLPFGTVVKVVNRDNGRSVELRVNDRGPFAKGRILDVSRAGAEALGMIGPGTAQIELFLVSPPPPDNRIYLVQAGAFRSRGKAESLQGRIQDEFPHLDVKVRSDDEWHRVQVGRYDVRTQATELVRQLRRAGFEAWVVAVAP